jgi:hypothetical protein
MAHDIRRIEKEIGQSRSSREGEDALAVCWHPCSITRRDAAVETAASSGSSLHPNLSTGNHIASLAASPPRDDAAARQPSNHADDVVSDDSETRSSACDAGRDRAGNRRRPRSCSGSAIPTAAPPKRDRSDPPDDEPSCLAADATRLALLPHACECAIRVAVRARGASQWPAADERPRAASPRSRGDSRPRGGPGRSRPGKTQH